MHVLWTKSLYFKIHSEKIKYFVTFSNTGACPRAELPLFVGYDCFSFQNYINFRKYITKNFLSKFYYCI